MLSSPRKPSRTIRIFSSAEYCLRVRRRIFCTTRSAGSLAPMDFCLISVPFGHYDDPEILHYENTSACPIGADVGQPGSRARSILPPLRLLATGRKSASDRSQPNSGWPGRDRRRCAASPRDGGQRCAPGRRLPVTFRQDSPFMRITSNPGGAITTPSAPMAAWDTGRRIPLSCGSHRILAAPLQRHPPPWQLGIPAAGPGNDRHAKLAARLRYAPPAPQLGGETVNALTFKRDRSTGAGRSQLLDGGV